MNQLLQELLVIAADAGNEILDVYESRFDVETKGDGSPLTMADQRAHHLIVNRLRELDADIPVLSEESGEDAFMARRSWNQFWLVDPLDGTKEFVKRNGEFTVNIALVRDGRPVLGVVHTPVGGVTHYAARGVGAFRVEGDATPQPISVRKLDPQKVTMVTSRSHSGAAVEAYRARLEERFPGVETAGMGSSLKICLVAEGSADIYPRLGPTSEWDTAAAHCVLEVAGGSVTTLGGESLVYNKPDILNPWFLAGGDIEFDWSSLARGLE